MGKTWARGWVAPYGCRPALLAGLIVLVMAKIVIPLSSVGGLRERRILTFLGQQIRLRTSALATFVGVRRGSFQHLETFVALNWVVTPALAMSAD